MAIVVHGTRHLVHRFGELIRQSLGAVLGEYFVLPDSTDSEMEFTERPQNLPSGSEFFHARFYQFLEPIVSDKTIRLDLQMTETSHTHFAGSSSGGNGSVDLTDLEMIMGGPGSSARTGALVRIIAERYYMNTRQFSPWPGMEEDEWREVYYGPAHEYSVGRVISVLGQLQGEMSDRFCELRGNYNSLMPVGTKAIVDPAHEAVALEPPIWHETRTFRMVEELKPPGAAYRTRTVTHIPDGPYGIERHDDTPVGARQRHAIGEQIHAQVF